MALGPPSCTGVSEGAPGSRPAEQKGAAKVSRDVSR
eukprot:CAMPEP_0170313888 /NCGR_PEP_ID=MMETSP0116_2-20130129/57510_1 /TAXON_ID=400756 /ORGANISM="Durinskia baltica, Strain CSIRO CS-38" /LENGTH=35 /DNA_ID= /DNA_START= /DNA_END= /DNA_ORIENTATION=